MVDSAEESFSERSESEMGSSGGGESVWFKPKGSRCSFKLTVLLVLALKGSVMLPAVEARSSSSSALLFASRLVSKGVGVDGTRDSLVTVALTSRSKCRCQKKVKGWRVTLASLIEQQTGQCFLRCTE